MDFSKAISELLNLTKPFVGRPDLIQGPGGNTSVKNESGDMLIKASGYRFNELSEKSGISAVNARAIADYFSTVEVISKEKCEKESLELVSQNILSDAAGIKFPKPSMETGFHAVLDKYVVHTHSVWTNLINCNTNSSELIQKISERLKQPIAYIPFVSPGFGLSYLITKELKNAEEHRTNKPVLFFLENHGIVAHGDSPSKIVDLLTELDSVCAELFSSKIESYPSTVLSKTENEFFPVNTYCSDFLKKNNVTLSFFDQVLFPDQTVFFNANISFNSQQRNKINIGADYKVSYACNEREAMSIHETLTAYLFLYSTLFELGQTLRLISGEEIDYINNMDMEKHRKNLMNKS
ncbi:class II aldolase/adducin family protein [Aurantibacillus circumpalustris]|uniref:class II aldolase/adducin family protein n=1 Tax=Aurantibacillus circumpalustris TaxID=3036359 RepID=UPI00295A6F90|nr:class II aldolase/adducin family protein [Aurantibacillus circumpalustris]